MQLLGLRLRFRGWVWAEGGLGVVHGLRLGLSSGQLWTFVSDGAQGWCCQGLKSRLGRASGSERFGWGFQVFFSGSFSGKLGIG